MKSCDSQNFEGIFLLVFSSKLRESSILGELAARYRGRAWQFVP